MQGPAERKTNPELNGIIPNSFDHIFEHIAANSSPLKKFMIQASYLEIYNEEVRDLLGKDACKKLAVKSSPKKGIFVQGLSTHTVANVADIDRVQVKGEQNRSVGSTKMNQVRSGRHTNTHGEDFFYCASILDFRPAKQMDSLFKSCLRPNYPLHLYFDRTRTSRRRQVRGRIPFSALLSSAWLPMKKPRNRRFGRANSI